MRVILYVWMCMVSSLLYTMQQNEAFPIQIVALSDQELLKKDELMYKQCSDRISYLRTQGVNPPVSAQRELKFWSYYAEWKKSKAYWANPDANEMYRSKLVGNLQNQISPIFARALALESCDPAMLYGQSKLEESEIPVLFFSVLSDLMYEVNMRMKCDYLIQESVGSSIDSHTFLTKIREQYFKDEIFSKNTIDALKLLYMSMCRIAFQPGLQNNNLFENLYYLKHLAGHTCCVLCGPIAGS